jgi:hypothetical protein
MSGHIPTQQSDENDRNEPTDDAADGFGALGVEFAAETGANLPSDEPAQCAANNEAKNCQDRCANEEADIISGDRRPDSDGKEAANGADHSPSECAHVGFTKGGFTHSANYSSVSYKCNGQTEV